MSKVKDLLHDDRIFKLMGAGLSFKDAAKLDRESAELLIEAWEIAMDGDGGGGCMGDGGTIVHIIHPE